MPEKTVIILMSEEVKGEAQVCWFRGLQFPEQEVIPAEEIIGKLSVCILSISSEVNKTFLFPCNADFRYLQFWAKCKY
jgi:hypothetical protein